MSSGSSRKLRRATRAAEAETMQLKEQNAALTQKNAKERERAQLKQIRALRARFGGGFQFEGGDGLSSTLG